MTKKVKINQSEKNIIMLLMFTSLVMVIGGSICIVLNYLGIKTGTDSLSSFIFTGLGFFFGLLAYIIYEHLKKEVSQKQDNIIEQ